MEYLRNPCPLCESAEGLVPVSGADGRNYGLCGKCYLISVDRKHLLDREKEKERYLKHQNGLRFGGYVGFLKKAIKPALHFIGKDRPGLDYGCGPAPTLSKLLEAEGYVCEDYDPFFAGHDLGKKFGFIFSTEVFEHFFRPGEEIRKIRSLLAEDGVLIVMTERWRDREHFSKWHYARDSSHVCFYHDRTFAYICGRFGFDNMFDDGRSVVILRKTGRNVERAENEAMV